ncbi:MAG: asparaginase [Alphaproteobacteria bacterium]|nr:asparaginase [Alphaproteobacteria bacterium]MBU0796737.1 asparaginase [Alphaproteobacteria bacterium]MBU0889047.1 asparaginase [Alphaproteobacteria bacterium]MBU1814067.1 asparaginase [Alphaproteobacteria bacterium]
MTEEILRVQTRTDSAAPIAVEVTRGGMVESFHRVIAAVTDASGSLRHAWGDADRLVYGRSAIKPIQAIALVESGAAEAFGLTDRQVSLACASHSGETMHTETVRDWLGQLGLGNDDLECGNQMPGHEPTAHAMIRAGETPCRIHNNCSGKHCGFLTTAKHLCEPTKGYIGADHPVQKRLMQLCQEMGGEDISGTPRGIDGCGIPVFGMSLKAMSVAMARMADPAELPAKRRDAILRIRRAVAAEPLMIAGTGRFGSVVLQQLGERILLKTGAEGVYTAALPELGLGIALKVDDGHHRASTVALGWILTKLGVLRKADQEMLASQLVAPITNWVGTGCGVIRPAPDLSL